MCSLTIDGIPHGPRQVTTCQIYMRDFADGQTIRVEPFRSTAFPVVRDLVVDRSAFDRIQQAGGYISVGAGPKPEPNSQPVHPEIQQEAMDAAICIGCGACVAACPNGAAMLFTGAKVTHLNLLPQGQPERFHRARSHGPPDGRRGLRRLHQPRRVPGRLPAGDLDQGHRRAEPRVPPGDDREAPPPPRHPASAVTNREKGGSMRKLDACDDRALVLEDNHLAALRWGAEQDRFPLSVLKETPGEVTRDDKGKMLGVFGSKEERVRVMFGRLALCVWVPLERQDEADSFVAEANAAIERA